MNAVTKLYKAILGIRRLKCGERRRKVGGGGRSSPGSSMESEETGQDGKCRYSKNSINQNTSNLNSAY